MKRYGTWFAAVPMVIALYWDFVASPDDQVLGSSQRIFYLHIGAATVSGLGFTLAMGASVAYLIKRQLWWDRLAAASVEISTAFTSMLLMSGVLWGKRAWGVWWTWDPRLTATLLLWVMFMAYLTVRQWLDEPRRRAQVAAVLAIVSYLDVPLDYLTIRWWKSIHPIVITTHGINMPPSMVMAMMLSTVALLVMGGLWLDVRMRLAVIDEGLYTIKKVIRHKMTQGGIS